MTPRRMTCKGMSNEGGFVLVGALLILLLLIVIGISATTSTVMEIQIAGSDRLYKETFYATDGGTQVGAELIEESISCPSGFTSTPVTGGQRLGSLFVPTSSLTLYLNPPPPVDIEGTATPDDPSDDRPVPANRNAFFNYGIPDLTGTTIPRTDMQLGGVTVQKSGGSLQQLAGYEGKGKGEAGGGGGILYTVHSLSYGNNNSESWLIAEWQHAIGQEGACNY